MTTLPPPGLSDVDELSPQDWEALEKLATVLRPKMRHLPSVVAEDPSTARTHPRFSPEDLFDFAETRFYVPETGKPIHLEPVQKVILRCMFDPEFAARHECPTGFQRYIYSTVKKSGKTTIAALVARWITERWGVSNEVYTVANDLDQSRGLVYDKILKSLQLDPRYDNHRDIIPGEWDIIRRDATHLPSRSVLKPLSGDYKGQAGMNPTATFWSELWGYTLEGSTRLWDELTPVPTRPRSIRYVETYAGFLGESLLLIDEYERGTRPDRGAKRLTRDDVPDWPGPEAHELPLYINPLSRQFTYWDDGVQARRMPWQVGPIGEAYYRSEAASLRPEAFDRLHTNLWVSSTSSFLPAEWWDNCRASVDELPEPVELDHDTPVIIGVDASVSGDCTALVAVSRAPKDFEKVMLRRARKWDPPPGGTLNYSLTLEPTLRMWLSGHIHPLAQKCDAHEYIDQLGTCPNGRPLNVLEVAYDAYQLHDMMTRLRNEGLCWANPFSQGTDRMVADHSLYVAIRERQILHLGDTDVRSHIEHSAAKIAKDSNTKMRLVKKASTSKIDLAVATSMAHYECKRLYVPA